MNRYQGLFYYLLLAWGLPIVIVMVVVLATPSSNKTRGDFPSVSFVPVAVEEVEKRGSGGSDHFELQVTSPAGDLYYHRDPEPEPIQELFGRFPKADKVTVLYDETLEGNVIMEIRLADSSTEGEAILQFESVMGEYASRRTVVYVVAGIWFGLANLLAYGLWKVDIGDSAPRSSAASK